MKSRKTLAHQPRQYWHAGFAAAAVGGILLFAGCSGGTDGVAAPTIIEANISTLAAQVGGGTQDVELYNDGTSDWTLYSMANRFAVTKVGMAKDTVSEITVPGYIQHITVVKGYGDKNFALLSMGGKGIGVVNITNPAAPTYVRTMTVDYMTPEYTYSDGGGTVFTEPASTVPHTSGPVNDMLVMDATNTPDAADDELFIANTAYGIQKTKLSNLIGAAADGALSIDSGVWTVKYAGENPWGGPLSLKLHGGKLYAALGFLGISAYDPADLSAPRLGAYNLYADCANRTGLPAGQQEDWFGYPQRKISCPSDSLAAGVVAGGVDADGMPTYLQAAEELGNKNDRVFYPWAEFDRYGKYYYNARGMDLVDVGGKTMAYIAYSLGGLIAVDVTAPAAITYVGYVPAAPAHGPDEPPINVDKKGILSHFRSGMLKEAGVMDVRVVPDAAGSTNYKAYYTDHFAGLVVVSGAEAPGAQWRNGSGGYNNDTDGKVYWPDYEFVKSYDMHPVVVGDESLPAFLVPDSTTGKYAAPMLLSTGPTTSSSSRMTCIQWSWVTSRCQRSWCLTAQQANTQLPCCCPLVRSTAMAVRCS